MSAELPVEYRCPVCFDPLLEPTRLATCCNVVLCKSCMTQTLQLGQDACPFCRRRCLRSLARRKGDTLIDAALAVSVREWLTSHGYIIMPHADAADGLKEAVSGFVVSTLVEIDDDDVEEDNAKAAIAAPTTKLQQMREELLSLRAMLSHSVYLDKDCIAAVKHRITELEGLLPASAHATENIRNTDDKLQHSIVEATKASEGNTSKYSKPLIMQLLARQYAETSEVVFIAPTSSSSSVIETTAHKQTTHGPLKRMWDAYVATAVGSKRPRSPSSSSICANSDVEIISPIIQPVKRQRNEADTPVGQENTPDNSCRRVMHPPASSLLSSHPTEGCKHGPMDKFMLRVINRSDIDETIVVDDECSSTAT